VSRRRLLAIVTGAALVLVGVPAAVLGSAFLGNTPLEDGRTFADGRVVTVVDAYVACFLVDTGDGYVLVDACADAEAEAVKGALEARGATLEEVRAVVLTHSHGDHVGGLGALSGATVVGLAPAGPLLAGEAAHEGPIPSLAGAVDSGARLGRAVADGEVLEWGEVEVQVFAVPGHTADSLAVRVGDALLLGDNAAVKRGGELVGATWIFSDDTEENARSLAALEARVADLGIRWLVPAHTGPVEVGGRPWPRRVEP
jgi:glyoxylase-like metal-dependent hydrolase (beta-lactamase superfamily II)